MGIPIISNIFSVHNSKKNWVCTFQKNLGHLFEVTNGQQNKIQVPKKKKKKQHRIRLSKMKIKQRNQNFKVEIETNNHELNWKRNPNLNK